MTDKQLKKLHRSRSVIENKLQLLNQFVKDIESAGDQITEAQLNELQLRVVNKETLFVQFESHQNEIETICTDEDLESEYKKRAEFTNLYYSLIVKIDNILHGCQQTVNTNITRQSRDNLEQEFIEQVPENTNENMQLNNSFNIKLPTIHLPKFSGSYTEWLEFKDTFESLIHNNSNISDIQKYHYLRASLEGNASQSIKSIEFNATSYHIAWNFLCDRFDNSQILVYNHIKAIFDISIVTKPSAFILRKISDDLFKHLQTLKALKLPVDAWDVLIIHVIVSKLDKESCEGWEKYKKPNEFPSLADFKEFLKSRADLLESIESRSSSSSKQANIKYKKFSYLARDFSCFVCKGNHAIYRCQQFLKLSPEDRIAEVKKLNLCRNCLKSGHLAHSCISGTCKVCSKKHNSLLHLDFVGEAASQQIPEVSLSSSYNFSQVLLSTAVVQVFDSKGNIHSVRALLDCGSQSNFITSSLFEKLGISRTGINMSIVGIGQAQFPIKFKCNITIKSNYNNFAKGISCFILSNISNYLPAQSFDLSLVNIPNNIQLADPHYNVSDRVDLLLGAQIFWNIIQQEHIALGRNAPVLQNTSLGWIVAGTLNIPSSNVVTTCNISTLDIQEQLQQFWQLEECHSQPVSPDDKICEELFHKSYKRQDSGQFMVAIPFKHSPEKLGESKNLALQRFLSLEKKIGSNSGLKDQYNKFMQEYIDLDHMSKVSDDSNSQSYFFPHHGVVREESLTTKLRVVFNGSAPTSSGWSFNDLQFVGPATQQDLISILLRFRQHKFVFISDITKMYRQVLITPEHRKFQRIWWRFDPNEELSIFELNTVTYGTKSGAYLATKCIKLVGEENLEKYPTSAGAILRDFYVDDFISGADNLEKAKKICKEVSDIMLKGHFELRKWTANDPRVLQEISNQKLLSHLQQFGDDKVKTLGLQWSSSLDIFSFNVKEIQKFKLITKRSILSTISQLFDPLGLLAPCIVLTKLIMQVLWSLQISWDDPIPDNIRSEWLKLYHDFQTLNNLTIPRHVIISSPVSIELHGFCDASQKAYGACVYARSTNSQGEICVKLLSAKSRVAPIKFITVARLELCGAVLLSRLMNKIKHSLTITVNCYYWTDSQIVLSWIKTQSNMLQIFVANRVSEIQEDTNINNWYHVRTKHNPADMISRGMQPNQFISNQLWWHGPFWLCERENLWPSCESKLILPEDLPEMKKSSTTLLTSQESSFVFNLYSNFTKLQRITAWCLRFINKCRHKEISSQSYLSVTEMNSALNVLIKISQQESFAEEIKLLHKNKQLKSNLKSLSLFLDNDGIIRVGGRIQNSNLEFFTKHPILLSGKHNLSVLIFRQKHLELCHAGPQLLLYTVRQRYWIVRGRDLARKTVHSCIRCFKFNPQSSTPIMGNLPAHRIQPTYPFLITGTDYSGAYFIRDRHGRGVKTYKCYICIFVCMCTKAVHIEPISDLSTESFMSTLNRFIARRGKPAHLYSDNGTAYVGANNEIQQLYKFIHVNNKYFADALASKNITWHFIPANAPNFGGIWESAIKSTKHHLKRVLADRSVTYEQFLTILAGIEGILNSRPLSAMSADPNDLQPLTPAHFLIGRPITSIPYHDVTHLKPARLSNFQHLQQIHQHFWKRWSLEYLTSLQNRSKWNKSLSTIPVGTLVLVKDNNLPPFQWKLGRVVEVHPGSDNTVRVISIKTQTNIIKRAVSKVCPLPLDTK